MNKNELITLKERLLADITPLVINGADDGADRFSVLLRIIQSGQATSEVYSRAYESANTIEEGSEKLNALLALLDEIEVDLSRSEDEEVSVDEQPQVEPTAQQHDQSQHYDEQREHHDQQNDEHYQG